MYDINNRLVKTNSTDGYETLRGYDAAGNPSFYQKTTENWSELLYDTDGNLIQDVSWHAGDLGPGQTLYSNFNSYGMAQHQESYYPGQYAVHDVMGTGYVDFDSPQEAVIGGTRFDEYGDGPYSSQEEYHGPNGEITGQRGLQDKRPLPKVLIELHAKMQESVYFETDCFGRILYKFELPEVDLFNKVTSIPATLTRYYYDIASTIAGSVSQDITLHANEYRFGNSMVSPGVKEITGVTSFFNSNHDGWEGTLGETFGHWAAKGIGAKFGAETFHQGSVRGTLGTNTTADFNIAEGILNPVSSSFPPMNSGLCTVSTGETSASIAQEMYGGTSYAGAIEESNNVRDNSLVNGRELRLPQMIKCRTQFKRIITRGYPRHIDYDTLLIIVQGC